VVKGIRPISIILLAMIVSGCSRYVDSRNPVRSLPETDPVPINLVARVDNGSVTLNWEVDDSAGIAWFRVYVADSTEASYTLQDSTTGYSMTLDGLMINQRYFFKVAAVMNSGLEGELSEAVSAGVMYLSIVIQNDWEYTGARDVQVQINTAGEATSHVMLSEDSTFTGAVFSAYVGMQMSFRLSAGDGVKTVYARLQFVDGSQTGELLSDDIILDTRAKIDSVFFAPLGDTFSLGDTITFGLVAGEIDGEASVSFAGVSNVPLFDDGTEGDLVAGDGIYSGYWVVPGNFTVNNGSVTGAFTDAAGNRAVQVTAQELLNVNNPPEPVELVAVLLPDTVSFTWTQDTEDDFASYRLYKGSTGSVSTADSLIAVETGRSAVTFRYALADATGYYFRIFVFDGHGLSTGSNMVGIP